MDSKSMEQVTGMLQAMTIALTALLATHPQPQKLRAAIDGIAQRAPHPHPVFQETLDGLRKAIP